MDRRAFVAGMVGGLARLQVAEAQLAGRVPQVGFLEPSSPSAASSYLDAFRRGLRELGYVDGQNIAIEYRWAEGRLERLPDLAAQLVRLKVDIIVAVSPPGALAAKRITATTPIVMTAVGDPVALGLVPSLARPDGNITGISITTQELAGKMLELLKEVVPRLSSVAVLWNPLNQGNVIGLRQAHIAARVLGVRVQAVEARSAEELERAFVTMTKQRPHTLWPALDPLFVIHQARIVEFARKNHLPAMYRARQFVDAGGLMSYGPSLSEAYYRTAYYIDKILKGTKPSDLPVEQPTGFELVINLKTAKALGVTIPPSLLQRADQVIE